MNKNHKNQCSLDCVYKTRAQRRNIGNSGKNIARQEKEIKHKLIDIKIFTITEKKSLIKSSSKERMGNIDKSKQNEQT